MKRNKETKEMEETVEPEREFRGRNQKQESLMGEMELDIFGCTPGGSFLISFFLSPSLVTTAVRASEHVHRAFDLIRMIEAFLRSSICSKRKEQLWENMSLYSLAFP
jgi:hypothetical protein